MLGRSGSGKTTTMKLINRLIDPTRGRSSRSRASATVEWDPIRLRRRIGYVIQEIGLFPHLTVEENIGVVPRLEGWPPERIRERARELLKMVGLDADRFAARMPREISGGQRQRVGVARALAADPPFILARRAFRCLGSDHPARDSARVPNPAARAGQDHGVRHPRHRRGFRARHAHRACSKTAKWSCSARRRNCSQSSILKRALSPNAFRRVKASGDRHDAAANFSPATAANLASWSSSIYFWSSFPPVSPF